MSWYTLWLFVHIMAAIPAFGPTFVFPLMGPMIARHPRHAAFGFEVFHAIETRLIIPLAITMPVSGALLVVSGHIDLVHTTWLLVGIILYLVAMGIALGVQLPATTRLLELARAMPAPPQAAVGAMAAGPPAEFLALVRRTRIGGMALTVLLVTIVALMVAQPGGTPVS